MQLCSRRLAPDEIDHELIWLSVSLGSVAVAATWFALGLPWPRCLFHDLTGRIRTSQQQTQHRLEAVKL